jgi:hypothetical protein
LEFSVYTWSVVEADFAVFADTVVGNLLAMNCNNSLAIVLALIARNFVFGPG